MNDLILGAPIVALVPGVVELAKRAGLPTRYAGVAAVASATVLVALAEVAGVAGRPAGASTEPAAIVAGWLLAGVIYGLAAAGLYSQTRRLSVATGVGQEGDKQRW
jgi:hypothetical protein